MALSESLLNERIVLLFIACWITWPKPIRFAKWCLKSSISLLLLPMTTLTGILRRRRSPDPYAIKITNHWIPREARMRHTHIVGATGSGKTVLIERLLFQDLKNGLGALVIDPKGDRELYERVKAYCASIGRASDLHYLSATHPLESDTWNPCQLGTSSNLQSKFYQSNTYSEPHYAKACEMGLLSAFETLLEKHPKGFDVSDLAREIEILSREERDKTLEGLKYDLHNLASGEWCRILGADKADSSQRPLSLLDVTKKNEILFVDLPTEASAVQSARIGKLLLQEMVLISGLRKAHPVFRSEKPFSIYIDEFDAFATEPFVTFLNKGRSSGFMIHIAHQTLSDLLKVSPQFAGQIMGNTNVRFVFRQDDPKDAETWAKFFGTKTVVKSTWQTKNGGKSGMESNRDAQEFRISPDTIKELRTGECVISAKTENILETIRIDRPATIQVPRFLLDRATRETLSAPKQNKAAHPRAPKFSAEDFCAEVTQTPKGTPT